MDLLLHLEYQNKNGELKLIFITRKCSWGGEILNHIKDRGISVDAIIIEELNRLNTTRFLLKRSGITRIIKIAFERLLELLAFKSRASWLQDSFYFSCSKKVYKVNNLNGQYCENLLKELKPDIIVLGYSPILRKNIIDVPDVGILNAHPGLLPEYRGINTIQWAVYNGDDVGVTIHFIDKSVDTGPILARKVIAIHQSDTLTSLAKKIEITAAKLMSDAIISINNGEEITLLPQDADMGKQYYRMPAKLVRETKRKLKERINMMSKSSKRTG
jgi:folate-dependent phosphoribosylglycinamide formyltransferase PurN